MLNEKELRALTDSITDPDKHYYIGVLYGDFGSRKTTTALRCLRRKAIYVHADRGWNAILNHPEEFRIGENVIPVEYKGLSQVRALLEATLEGQPPFGEADLHVLDTWSQMQERYIDFLYENFTMKGREPVNPIPGAKDEMGTRLEQMNVVGLTDYRLTRDKMRPIIDAYVRAPIDVIFLTHVRKPSPIEVQNGIVKHRPNVTDAVWQILGRDATFIGFMEEKRGEYLIDFKPTTRIEAKSQIASLTDQKIKAEELPKYLADWKEQ